MAAKLFLGWTPANVQRGGHHVLCMARWRCSIRRAIGSACLSPPRVPETEAGEMKKPKRVYRRRVAHMQNLDVIDSGFMSSMVSTMQSSGIW